MAIDPVLPRRVYAATAPDESNPHQPTLFLSTNRGRTWRPANRGLGDLQWMLALAVPPADNLTVFAGIV